jgi:hypothetical protein
MLSQDVHLAATLLLVTLLPREQMASPPLTTQSPHIRSLAPTS